MYKITPEEYKVFAKYILDISGIMLGAGKEYLIETRLNPILMELGCRSFAELYHRVRTDQTQAIEKKIIDAISTNETYFFRDKTPFELIQHKIIPDLIDSRSKSARPGTPIKIRIWSAASSTGQEIYSIAIVLKELYLDPSKYDIKLIGTDISNAAITQASYGKYNKFEMARGLPPEKIRKYFKQEGDGWRIQDELRAMAVFKKINLMQPLIGMGKFDIIFCRNVAIYFNPPERTRLYEKLAGVLERDGYLLIGATESLTNDTKLFEPKKYLRTVFYQLR
ncbi:MAG: protein-glutamate O-methyltransferase CheR [Desulfobacteraceae bacterium]|nr:MAG: protein-glutamate O-methyltransferase CheR [Desulfobacteraceae bacterium]